MLEIKKLELQKMKVLCAKQEMELKVLEKKEDIKRLEENIENQQKTIESLEEQLAQLQGE